MEIVFKPNAIIPEEDLWMLRNLNNVFHMSFCSFIADSGITTLGICFGFWNAGASGKWEIFRGVQVNDCWCKARKSGC